VEFVRREIQQGQGDYVVDDEADELFCGH
jgi:hypothetical protein